MITKRKEISAQLLAALLEEACQLGNVSQTDALILGLQSLIAGMKGKKLVESAGKFHFTYNADAARERSRL